MLVVAAGCQDVRPGEEVGDSRGALAGCAGSVGSMCECNSLFAYRVFELAVAGGGAPVDCNDQLGVDVGFITYQGGSALCKSGQTANGCRDDWYASPPAVADMASPNDSHRAKFLPRCADGGDGCATDEVVCQDGLRPMMYVDKAVDMAGADMTANTWVFYLGGEGGPCSDAPRSRNNRVTGDCWNNYRFGGTKNKTEFMKAMSTMHPDFSDVKQTRALTGIMDDASAFGGTTYNNFRHYNRIQLDRCTDWASDAEEMNTVALLKPAGWSSRSITDKVNVWHRGLDTWKSLFHSLTTSAGRDIDGNGTIDLPSLNNATTILLAGSSDSSGWLVMAADELRSELQSISPLVEVKIVIDGLFDPMLENEARYNANPWSGNVFDGSFDNPLGELLPVGIDPSAGRSYSNANYAPGGALRAGFDARNTFLDASCIAVHGPGAMECYSRTHVLLHHVDTDFFIFAEQNDSVVSAGLEFSDDRAYALTPAAYRTRVRDQAEDIELSWGARAEEGAAPNRSYFLPWGDHHVHLADNTEMQKTMTRCTSNGAGGWLADPVPIAEALQRWLIFGAPYFAIEDARGANPPASPHWITGDGTGLITCGNPR